ncbi:hypothetical protein ACRALDRAFT_1072442 [Sodiomyces alcalophilus JCM 7366]|uniref:uncharacterized protein n=1 Tax=Sodiomyces alcalophilus JCM 7366 TaxID=591952 RepID=UPI0039B3BAE6
MGSLPTSVARHPGEPRYIRDVRAYSEMYDARRSEGNMEEDASQQHHHKMSHRPDVKPTTTLAAIPDRITLQPMLVGSASLSQSSLASEGTRIDNRSFSSDGSSGWPSPATHFSSSTSFSASFPIRGSNNISDINNNISDISSNSSDSSESDESSESSNGSHSSESSISSHSSHSSESSNSSNGSDSGNIGDSSGIRDTAANTGSNEKLPLPRLPELDTITLDTLASHYATYFADSNGSRRSSFRRNQAPGHPRPPSQSPLVPQPSFFYDQPYQHVFFPPLSSVMDPTETSLSPLRLRARRNPPARGSRCNIKYTIEQKDFIDYWRIDRQDRETPWDDVVREFNRQFKGPHRRNGGLQSAYYRENKKIPVTDREGKLVFNAAGEVKTIEVPVREAKSKLHSIKAIGLLATHPERAIRYPWVSSEHKRKIWRLAQVRQAQLDAAMQQRPDVEGHPSS